MHVLVAARRACANSPSKPPAMNVLGIEVARQARPNHFHGLGFSLAASGSLREAFERLIRYFRLVTEAWICALERPARVFVSWRNALISGTSAGRSR